MFVGQWQCLLSRNTLVGVYYRYIYNTTINTRKIGYIYVYNE